jgi:hypothetical protein
VTTAVAPVTLTYDGTDIQDLEGIFLEIIRGAPGEPAEIRGRDDVALGRDGRVARNRRKDRRVIELVGWVKGTGATEATQRGDYWDNRITLEGVFDSTATAVLSATLPSGDVYTISCRLNPPILYNQVVPAYATVSLELESVDPDWTLGS